MTYSVNEKPLEKRVAELETALQDQQQRFSFLVTVMAASKSKPFDDPLKQFFDFDQDAGKFFDPLKDFKCATDCAKVYQRMEKNAGGDRRKLKEAADALAECHRKCQGLI